MDPLIGGAIVGGALSLLGGERANQQRRREAARNRQFQERMRNTQWQAAVADMQAAGLNPALAYSQGPAASPGGSMASQEDTLSPAVSSAMQMKRLNADVEAVRAQARKTRAEAHTAEANEVVARMRSHFLVNTFPGQEEQLLWSLTKAEVNQAIQKARQTGILADIGEPMAKLSQRLGEWTPILGLLSTLLPGGVGMAANRLRRSATRRSAIRDVSRTRNALRRSNIRRPSQRQFFPGPGR